MKTPSHAIINLAILGKRQLSPANLIIVIGGILPDIPIFLFFFWAKYIARLPEAKIWSEAYYEPFVQNVVALFHSIPLAVDWLVNCLLFRLAKCANSVSEYSFALFRGFPGA